MSHDGDALDATPSVGGAAIVVWSDVRCPWAHLAVHRLHTARRSTGLEHELVIDHRPLPLERMDGAPESAVVRSVVEALAGLTPEAGWEAVLRGAELPSSSLDALAAVQAVKGQTGAAERLDRALRHAVFRDGRDVSTASGVLAVAEGLDGVDADALAAELASGRPAATVETLLEEARASGITTSPTVVVGTNLCEENPGIRHRWDGGPGGTLVIEQDEPEAYVRIVELAMASKEFD